MFEFLAHQRGDRSVIRIGDRESGLSARTIARRLSSISWFYAYLVARAAVRSNPVPRGGEAFNLSAGEWDLAKRFADESVGDRYGVLVVRRTKRGGLPASMDLLLDPVALVNAGSLRQEIDGYRIAYQSGFGGARR